MFQILFALLAIVAFATALGSVSGDNDLDFKNIKIKRKAFCVETRPNHLKWLSHKNFLRCVNIVSDFKNPSCLYAQLERENIAYEQKSIGFMLNRNVVEKNPLENILERSIMCDHYLIITKHVSFITKIFESGQKHFYPFTRIFLLTPDSFKVPEESLMYALNYGYNVFGLANNFFLKKRFLNLDYGLLTNLHTNKTMNSAETDEKVIESFFGSYKSHPLFDPKITKNRPFRVSLRHCRPHVIIKNKENKT